MTIKLEDIVIEKNIPRVKESGDRKFWQEILEKMEEGDSIVLPRLDAIHFSQSVLSTAIGTEWRIALKKVDSKNTRCWKVRRMRLRDG
jgi:hypothetical protein